MTEVTSNQVFVAGYSKHRFPDKNDVKDLFRDYGHIREVSYKGPFCFIVILKNWKFQIN